ncbi:MULTISPECIES: hypothetical protein [Streptomyces]|uniref:hypothetical protein n=1 Tax=Streptomyces TaxID=1883 RepID=UPI00131E18D8|nr:hypothetical protein [Streptomyces virginiae]
MNSKIARGSLLYGEISQAAYLLFSELPTPDALEPVQAQQLLVHLGLWGASVGRHHQEHEYAVRENPELAFKDLPIGIQRQSFRKYFEGVSLRTGTGHPNRDAYASLVRWNTPTAIVTLDGNRLAQLPGIFCDSEVRTYTNTPGEISFLELLKKAEALELAANETLFPLISDEGKIGQIDSIERMGTAALLLSALRRLNLDFVSLPDDRALTSNHFLDVLRQFAVHWDAGDIPPSGAQDYEYLRRDFMLGINFPNYSQHVRRIFPGLLAEERDSLERMTGQETLPEMIMRKSGIDSRFFERASPEELMRCAEEHPEIAACYFVLRANARLSSSHLMLTQKYLFKPYREREESGTRQDAVVPNNAGTTGMLEHLLTSLTLARKNHLLSAFDSLGRGILAKYARMSSEPNVTTATLCRMVKFEDPAPNLKAFP